MRYRILALVVFLAGTGIMKAQVITATNIDNTILVDGTKYPCSDVGINAALAALPSSVGTVIVPGCQGTHPISSTVTIGNGQTLILNHGIKFQPQSPELTMFSVNAGGTLNGLWADVSNESSFGGRVINLTDNYRDLTHTTIRDIFCTGGPTTTVVSGNCIWISASDLSNQSVTAVVIDNVKVQGFYSAISLSTSGTGFINGNFFSNVWVSWANIGFGFNATGGSISGNLFSNISYQCCGNQTASYGIYMEGSALVSENVFSGLGIWDTISPNVPITATSSSNYQNLFIGRYDGSVNDPNGQNQYFYTTPSNGGYSLQGIHSLTLGANTVAQLPSAASAPGGMMYVTDSIAIRSEGQTCAGGSTNKALAFSNGSVWKCF